MVGVQSSVLPASVFKNKCFLCFFSWWCFFVVESVFSAFFTSKCVFFFLYHAGECRVLQFNIKISGFPGTSLINLLKLDFLII